MTCRIALDAMGGDHGLPVNIAGALLARKETDHEIILVGDRDLIQQELEHHGARDQFLIQHAPTVVGMHEKPADACRSKKDSSIMVAAELVSQGKADALISAGNSGATMAASLWHLRRLPGVSRPAIATLMPTLVGNAIVLDVGANVDCKPKHLLQFAVMGSIYAHAILNIPSPRVGLLTIGEEEGKGNLVTVETHPMLKASGLNYVGHVEGRDVPSGVADVFVCDGFVGNILLKFGEGLAAAVLKLIKNEVRKHPLAIFGKYLLKGAFKELLRKTDPSEYGGAPLLGVNGVALISHGGADAKAIKNAVRTAGVFVEAGINRQISDRLQGTNAHIIPLKVSA
ncbi:MAG: phosphate acyltransferase PlsX [Elusimicrobia bacterium]|nr:phosphate acyltransferase PlsX [Elusimicrobiota bacterium]